MKNSLKGKWVEVAGQFRSHNKEGEDGRKHLELFLFVTQLTSMRMKMNLKKQLSYAIISINLRYSQKIYSKTHNENKKSKK